MLVCRPSQLIEIRRADKRGRGGRGVFAVRDIAAETVIERVPVLVIPKGEIFGKSKAARHLTSISWYVFGWNEADKPSVALALGCGSIYNHSEQPNAHYVCDPPDVMEFVASRTIKKGEEIFINYRGDEGTIEDLGFDVAD